MKWRAVVSAWLGILVSSAHAQTTIESLTLVNAQNPVQIWMTEPRTTEWILGVGDQPAGPLLNAPDSSISGLPPGSYWLFADPGDLGRFPVLSAHLSDGSTLVALFRVVGSNGSGQSWVRLAGSPLLSLGWATGTIDLVGTTNGVHPDGIADDYLTAWIGVPAALPAVPEPAAAALMASGAALLGGMAGLRRRHQLPTGPQRGGSR